MSNDVVGRLTEKSPVVLLNIVIVYLLEDESLEPWFIGTEKCEVLTQKVSPTSKRNHSQGTGRNKLLRAIEREGNMGAVLSNINTSPDVYGGQSNLGDPGSH